MGICQDFNRHTNKPCKRAATEQTPAGRNLCPSHADAFWEQHEETLRKYPDSATPPSWFDPTYAGETW